MRAVVDTDADKTLLKPTKESRAWERQEISFREGRSGSFLHPP